MASDDLLEFNPSILSKGGGFINLGATCYFNSLLQCLLSCTSIHETLRNIKDLPHVKNNRLAMNMLHLCDTAQSGGNIREMCIPIWRDIIRISQGQNNRVKMDSGQQDVHEGLMMFLDAMETIPEVRRLFEHRHRIEIRCGECERIVVDKRENNLVFEVQQDLKTEQSEQFKDLDEFYGTSMQLNDFLRKQNSYVDQHHKCPKCEKKCEKFKTTTLTMIPEILPVVIKRYGPRRSITNFPNELVFSAKGGGQKLVYQLVAQSEHSGSTMGGHYWAVCRRADGWKYLNDSSVSAGMPGPTVNSYVLFYHYMRTEQVAAAPAPAPAPAGAVDSAAASAPAPMSDIAE